MWVATLLRHRCHRQCVESRNFWTTNLLLNDSILRAVSLVAHQSLRLLSNFAYVLCLSSRARGTALHGCSLQLYQRACSLTPCPSASFAALFPQNPPPPRSKSLPAAAPHSPIPFSFLPLLDRETTQKWRWCLTSAPLPSTRMRT